MKGKGPNRPETRALLAKRFKIDCSNLGLSVSEVAKTLRVTPRTVQNWLAGKTAIPYASRKLLRILNRFELPGQQWRGWLFHSGKLWTPEGRPIEPQDGAWWSLLVRQARCFHLAYDEANQLRYELRRAWQAGYLTPVWEDAPDSAADLPGAAQGGAAAGLVPSINNAETNGEISIGAASSPVPPSGPGEQIFLSKPPALYPHTVTPELAEVSA